jgi:hypothetical protein
LPCLQVLQKANGIMMQIMGFMMFIGLVVCEWRGRSGSSTLPPADRAPAAAAAAQSL